MCLVFYRLFLVFFQHLKTKPPTPTSELKALLAAATTAFAYLPDVWFFAKDKHGRFIAANPAFLTVCGLSELNDLLGKTDLDFFPKKIALLYMHDDRKVVETGVKLENQIEPMPPGKSNTALIMTTKFPLLSADGRILGLAGIARNLSETPVQSSEMNEFTKTIDHIERFSRERFDLPALAARQGMSPSQFERRFKRIFQMTPSSFQLQVRLRQARKDLLATTKLISEIALEYGFYDQSHFTKRFIAVYGIPPLRFRKMADDSTANESASEIPTQPFPILNVSHRSGKGGCGISGGEVQPKRI
ncbi:MAG: AraC family transcriptional regulator [Spartobacteria bacterium]|nr:AraC family transcriptional regulator [Spartobacteria bacterium]